MNPFRSPPVISVVVALAACRPAPTDGPLGERFDLGPEGSAVLAVAGPAPLAVPVLAVNAWGAAVPADPVAVEVGGSPVEVELDAYGYGVATVTQPGAVRVTAGSTSADVLVLNGPVQGPPLPRSHPPAGVLVGVAAASGGAIVATTDAVWFAGSDGLAWPVLRPVGDGAIRGVVSGHLDRDGVLDAIAWTDVSAIVLRGRPGGGLTWVTGIRADGYEVLGAGIGDTTGDGLPDFALAWASGLDGAVEVWEAQGAEDWEPVPSMLLPAVPVGVAIGDNADQGVAQVTVTDDDGGWTRVVRSAAGLYSVTGPTSGQINLDVEPGAVPLSDGDYNGDVGEELFLANARIPAIDRHVQVWDLVGTRPSTLGVDSVGAWIDVEDSTGDGLVDLWLLPETGVLTQLTWAEGLNARRQLATLPDPGPLAASDQDDDGIAEVLVAGNAAWRWWGGTTVPAEGRTWWGAVAPDLGIFAAAMVPPLVTTELDADLTTTDVAGFAVTTGTTVVKAYRFIPDPDPLPVHLGTATLGPSLLPVDLAACDGTIYALAGGKLFSIAPGTEPLEVQDQAVADGEAVACGEGPSGSVVGVLDDGLVTLRDAGLSVTGTRSTPGAKDLGLVGGDVITCEVEGCSVAAWNWRGDGAVAASTDASGTLVDGDPVVRLPGTGALAVGDIDGDGHEDLLSTTSGALVVHRSGGNGFGVTEAWHEGGVVGPAILADVTGDGVDDPVWLDGEGSIVWPVTPSP